MHCYNFNYYKKGGMIAAFFTYNARLGVVDFIFSNPNSDSLGDYGRVFMKLQFVKMHRIDDSWGINEFYYSRNVYLGAHTFELLVGGRKRANKFFHDIGGSRILLLKTESDAIVAVIYLNNSAEAFAKLQECALSIAGYNPEDPFAK